MRVAPLVHRPRHLRVAAIAGGLALADAPIGWTIGAPLLALVSSAAMGLPRRSSVMLTVTLLAGVTAGDLRIAALLPESPPRGPVEARAVLLEPPRSSEFGASAPVELIDGPWAGGRLMARTRDPEGDTLRSAIGPGSILKVSGYARAPRRSESSDFDYPAHLRRQGIAAELQLTDVSVTGERRGGIAGLIDAARERAGEAIGSGLSSPDAALLRGMVLGQDEQISPLVRDDFRRAGLAHILAVSGQNILLLAILALVALRATPLSDRGRLAAVAVLILVYIPLAGAGPSLQRAGVMGIAALAATLASRPASRAYAVLLAAVVTLALNPLAIGDPGWQLSFAAVIGIAVWSAALRRRLDRLPAPLAEGVALTVAATLATAPLLALHFKAISIAALPVNVLAIPAIAPAMWAGMIEMVVGQLSAIPVIGEPTVELVCGVIGWFVAVPLGFLEGLARFAASLPWAQATTPELPAYAGLALGYGAIVVVALVARRMTRRAGPRTAELAGRWRTASPPVRRAGVVAAVGVIALAGAAAVAPPAGPDRPTISFLDVGQGDAILIQDGAGAAVLFDGGRPEARVVHLLRASGVTRLSLVVATHVSADHHGGLAEVVRRVPVDTLLENGDGTTDPSFLDLLSTARAQGVDTISARAGQRLQVGAIEIDVLSPPRRPPGLAPEDPNPRAVISHVRIGELDLLLSADAESPAILPLALPRAEILKVAHHGSADPGLPALLERVAPKVAAIDVGAENTYGHPHPSTLAALDDAGVQTYRTDLEGTVRFTLEAGRLAVRTGR